MSDKHHRPVPPRPPEQRKTPEQGQPSNQEKPLYRTAVALTYDQENAPYVSASGKGLVADEILRLADEHGILVHEDRVLVEALATLELGEEIPRELYQAVAEVIAFAYSLKAAGR